MSDPFFLDDVETNKRDYAQLLKDIHWVTRSKSGNLWNAPITRWDANGKPDGITTPAVELGYTKTNNAILRAKLDNLITLIGQTNQKLDQLLAK